MRNAIRLLAILITVTAASVGIAWSATPRTSTTATAARGPVHRIIWIGQGGGEQCGINSCSGGGTAHAFTMPGRGRYAAAVTVSFEYRATGSGTFGTDLQLGSARVTPARRALAASTDPTSTTVVYRCVLVGGRAYGLSPAVRATGGQSGPYSTSMRKVLVDISAYPIR